MRDAPPLPPSASVPPPCLDSDRCACAHTLVCSSVHNNETGRGLFYLFIFFPADTFNTTSHADGPHVRRALKHKQHRQLAGQPSPDKEVSRGYSRLGNRLAPFLPLLHLLWFQSWCVTRRFCSHAAPCAPLAQLARCKARGKEVLLPIIAISRAVRCAPYGHCCVSMVRLSSRGTQLAVRAICRAALWINKAGSTEDTLPSLL